MELTPEFNLAAGGPNLDGAASDGPTPHDPTPSGAAVGEPRSEAAELEPTVVVARAELDVLEKGRPKPAPHHNLNPPKRVMKATNSLVELHREARVRALNAYVAFHGQEPSHDENDEVEGLEFCL